MARRDVRREPGKSDAQPPRKKSRWLRRVLVWGAAFALLVVLALGIAVAMAARSMPGFSELGRTGAELALPGSSLTTFVATPAVEFGGRMDLLDGVVLRPYMTLGASFASNDAWQTTARFLWAPLSAGSFVTSTPLPDVLGNLDLGLQAVTRDNLEIKVEYGLNVGQDFLSQRGMARFAVHF